MSDLILPNRLIEAKPPEEESEEEKMGSDAQFHRQLKIGEDEFEKIMAPPGSLKLPPLLEARRWEYHIPDGVFEVQAAFDRIFVVQLGIGGGETFQGTQIHMTDTAKQAAVEGSYVGIICSAGLSALDRLKSNGINLGHICFFVRLSPWRIPVENVEGADNTQLLILHAGDVVGSVDSRRALVNGKCKVINQEIKREGIVSREHYYVDEEGITWNPEMPWMAPEY